MDRAKPLIMLRKAARALDGAGLSPKRFLILHACATAPQPLTLSALCRRFGWKKPGILNHVVILEYAALLKREERRDDGFRVEITALPAAQAVLDSLAQSYAAAADEPGPDYAARFRRSLADGFDPADVRQAAVSYISRIGESAVCGEARETALRQMTRFVADEIGEDGAQ